MLMRGRGARLVPCTPLGVMELLQRSGIGVQGRSAVVVGDSNIVGTPLAALLRDQGAAAVTVCHRLSYQDWCGPASAPQRAAADACLPRLPGPSTPVPVPVTTSTSSLDQSSQRTLSYSAPGKAVAAAATASSTRAAASDAASQSSKSCRVQADVTSQQLLPAVTKGADILVVAVGVPEMVKREWVSQLAGA
jgi:5,10-methylene-tetrahydrofolate dehydrogenase/methenyl tetrahydrofolate cyclohydrolase